MSDCDLSVHLLQTPAPMLASVSLAQRCSVLLAEVVSCRMMALTTDSFPGASQFMPSVVWRCLCASLTTTHIGAPGEGFQCNSFSVVLHESVSLSVNRHCLESNITGAGVSPDSLISAPCVVVGSACGLNLACRLRRSWRLSHLPSSLELH